jgi:hypothetical protein
MTKNGHIMIQTYEKSYLFEQLRYLGKRSRILLFVKLSAVITVFDKT